MAPNLLRVAGPIHTSRHSHAPAVVSSAPLVSVVLPVFNDAETIDRAVRSMLDQTLLDLELIVVDDGSTDGTWGVLSELSDRRVRLVRLPRNGGLTAALIRGCSLARGHYLARQDGNDWSPPIRLQAQAERLEADPGCVAVGTSYRVVRDGKGVIMDRGRVPDEDRVLRWKLLFDTPFPHPSLMIRGRAFQQVGGYDRRMPYAQDFDLLDRLGGVGAFGSVPDVEIECTWDEGTGISAVHWKDQRDCVFQVGARAQSVVLGRPVPETTVRAAWKVLHQPESTGPALAALGVRHIRALAKRFGVRHPEARSELLDLLGAAGRELVEGGRLKGLRTRARLWLAAVQLSGRLAAPAGGAGRGS